MAGGHKAGHARGGSRKGALGAPPARRRRRSRLRLALAVPVSFSEVVDKARSADDDICSGLSYG